MKIKTNDQGVTFEKSKTVEFHLTQEQLAKAFWEMDSYSQALFFNHIAKLAEGSTLNFQLQHIVDEKVFVGGKKVFKTIADYAEQF